MERVQLAAKEGNAYISTDGRRLYPMGDIAPQVGDWVYANGNHIYGHTTGGGEGVITVGDMCVPIMLGRDGPIEE